MVKINKIYTRSGDDGTTGLVGGNRVTKDSLRVCAYGEVDELNSFIGAARTSIEKLGANDKRYQAIAEQLATIQNELFDVGAILASPEAQPEKSKLKINSEQIERFEKWIDQATASLPELKSFVLPGGSRVNSELHIARAVCRRCERSVLHLSRSESVPGLIIKYLNRLSDLLFALARQESALAMVKEYLWQPGKSS